MEPISMQAKKYIQMNQSLARQEDFFRSFRKSDGSDPRFANAIFDRNKVTIGSNGNVTVQDDPGLEAFYARQFFINYEISEAH
jgi:hypothetical protein